MKRNYYKKLTIYLESLELAKDITSGIYNRRSFRLVEQIISSAVSIPSNIAEGSQMNTVSHFKKYLFIASSSAAELETQLTIIQTISETNNTAINTWIYRTNKIQSMIRGLIKYLDDNNK
ncbi:MAG: four helix bundle protein [Bacteroidetes bacterium]|nr:four helix bundle protein [Bacteroidota bacterium]